MMLGLPKPVRSTTGILGLLLLPLGCTDPTQDSEGFSRVELSSEVVALDEPLFRIGGAQAEGPLAFGRVRRGMIDRSGRLWIGDEIASEIVRVDSDGELLDRLGGPGEGPGEFANLEMLGWRGEQIVIYDISQARVTLIDAVSDSVETFTVPSMWDERPVRMMGLGPAGGHVFTPVEGADVPGGQVFDGQEAAWMEYAPQRLVVQPPAGDARVLLTEPLNEGFYHDGDNFRRHPLATAPVARVVGDHAVFVGTLGGDVFISVLDSEEPRVFNMSDTPGIEVTGADRTRVREFLEGLSERARPNWATLEQIEERGLPERRQFFDRLVISRDSTIWLRRVEGRGDPTRRWDVITVEGAHVGSAILPQGEDVMAVNREWIASISRDELDVDVVSGYTNPFGGESPEN